MASPLEAILLLCDAAQADPGTGKVHMLGAGWSITRNPFMHAVVVLVKVPWDRTNQPLPLTLELLTADGDPKVVDSPEGKGGLQATGKIEVGRPAGLAAGSMIDHSFSLNVPPLTLAPGRYYWRLNLADQERTASFTVLG